MTKPLILLVIFCVVLSNIIAQILDFPVPIVKQGKWFLFDGIRETVLPESYTFVNTFDESGKAYFLEGNAHGIIDQSGKEVMRSPNMNIVQYGNGIFGENVDSGFEIFSVQKDIKIKCSWYRQINRNWIFYEADTLSYLFNVFSGKSLQVSKKVISHDCGFDYVLLEQVNSPYKLFDPMGEFVSNAADYPKFEAHSFYFKGDSAHFYVDANGKFEFDANSDNVQIDENEIHYTIGGVTRILDRMNKQKIIEFKCDALHVFGDHYMAVKGTLRGLIDKRGKPLIPINYNSISKTASGYYVYLNQQKGFIGTDFVERIPCKYFDFYYEGEFIRTKTYLGAQGLLNRMNYKEILPAFYSRLEIRGLQIKAYSKDKMTILELNKDGSVKNRLSVDGIISLMPHKEDDRFLFDRRLLDVGWYYDTLSYFDKKSNSTEIKHVWGIRTGDSIVMKAKLPVPTYLSDAPIGLVKLGKERGFYMHTFFGETELTKYNVYKLENGKKPFAFAITYLDTNDFSRGDYVRMLGELGPLFYFRDHSIKKVSYFQTGDAKVVRYCNTAAYEREEKETNETVNLTELIFNGSQRYHPNLFLTFKDAQWNYLNRKGDSLSQEPFAFAHNFLKGTGVVKGKKGWGVINEDTTVIPLIYSKIERLKAYSDTVFKVQLNQAGKIYLDSSLTIPMFPSYQVEKRTSKMTVLQRKDEQILIDRDNKIIASKCNGARFYPNGYFLLKEKKDRVVYDSLGNELCRTKLVPLDFLTDDYFVLGDNSEKGVLNLNGDTLLPMIYSQIIRSNKYIIAKNVLETTLFDLDFKVIRTIKEGHFLVDLKTDKWLIYDGKAVTIFDASNQKVAKWKVEEGLMNFYDNYIYLLKGGIVDLMGIKLENVVEFKDVSHYEGGYVALQDEDKKWHLYDKNWKLLTDPKLNCRRIHFHGDHVFSMQTKNGCMVYDFLNEKKYMDFKEVQGDFSEKRILVRQGEFYLFLDRDFKDVYHRRFKNAHVFRNQLATVAEESGWTILGIDGQVKTYPSFTEIRQINANLFELSRKPLFGLIDSHGNQLIKPEYEKITLLKNGIIQTIKEGEIHYFDRMGKLIY